MKRSIGALAHIGRPFSAKLCCVGYLALVSKKTAALLVVISVVCATTLVDVFKAAFGRLRPGAAYAELTAMGLSFPSGHTSMSASVFLTLGALLASSRSRVCERPYILLAATLLTVLVGLSRVMLGLRFGLGDGLAAAGSLPGEAMKRPCSSCRRRSDAAIRGWRALAA